MVLVILRIVIGGAAGAFQPIAGAIISNSFGANKNKAMSIFNWGIYLGFSASFLCAQIFEGGLAFGWKTSYILSGILGFIMIPFIILLVKVSTFVFWGLVGAIY